jgi:hypothetical protein
MDRPSPEHRASGRYVGIFTGGVLRYVDVVGFSPEQLVFLFMAAQDVSFQPFFCPGLPVKPSPALTCSQVGIWLNFAASRLTGLMKRHQVSASNNRASVE